MRITEGLQAWGRILSGRTPSVSIELTRECPLRCPGCYAYGDAHLGGGVTLTEIRASDLGGSFQFNLQACIGTHYFFRDNMSASLDGRYIHISSAGMFTPNNGVNTLGGFLSFNVFF